jgi:hypothetical protein
MTPPDPVMVRFVRGTLGCGCPDEVFESIEYGACPGGHGARRLLVGRRLLVYALQRNEASGLAAAVRRLAAAGLAERDSRGFNRFRLAVATEAPPAARAEATAAFAAATAGDERAHLHWLAPADLPASLSSPDLRSG